MMKNKSRIAISGFTHFNQLFMLIMLFAIPAPMSAQYGIKIGSTVSSFNHASMIPTPYKGYDIDLRPYLGYDVELVQTNPQKPLFAPFIGVYRRFELSNRLGFQPEINYTQKGVNFSLSDYERMIYKVVLNQIEMPVSMIYQVVQKQKFSGDLYIGGYGAYRIDGHKRVAFHNAEVEKTRLNSTRSFDWGLHMGVDLRYQIKNQFLLIDIRFFFGQHDIFVIPDDWTAIHFETHNTRVSGLTISIGYEI